MARLEIVTTNEYKQEQYEHYLEISKKENFITEKELFEKITEVESILHQAESLMSVLYETPVKTGDEERDEYITNMLKYSNDELEVSIEDLERLQLTDDNGHVFY